MRFLKPSLIAGLLLVAGLLVGCNKEPPRMKNQPPNLEPKNGGFERTLPRGGKKVFDGVQ